MSQILKRWRKFVASLKLHAHTHKRIKHKSFRYIISHVNEEQHTSSCLSRCHIYADVIVVCCCMYWRFKYNKRSLHLLSMMICCYSKNDWIEKDVVAVVSVIFALLQLHQKNRELFMSLFNTNLSMCCFYFFMI